MSWNILSPQTAARMQYLYKRCKLENRWPLIVERLLKVSPDILFLQELEELQFSELQSVLKEYNGYYVQRPGNIDGCGTFLKKKLDIISVKRVNLSRPDTISNRENVCMLILAKQNDEYLILGNTHILYNPKRGLIKAAQIICIFENIYKLMQEYDCFDSRIILGGDFNLSPLGLLYHFITQGSLKLNMVPEQLMSGQLNGNSPRTSLADVNELPNEIFHPFQLKSSYEAVQTVDGKAWKFTQDLKGKHKFNGLFVDYIFYGHLRQDANLFMKSTALDNKFSPLQFTADPPALKFIPSKLELLTIGTLPDPLVEEIQPMPDGIEPSDHFAVYSEFH